MIWFPCRSHITRELGAGGEKKTKNVFPSVHLDQVQHLRCLRTHRGLAGNTCGQPGVFGVPGAWASVLTEASQASWRGGRTRPQLTLVAGSLLATWPGDHEASTAFTWRLGARRHHLVTVTAGDRWSHQSPPIRKCPSLTASPFQLHDSVRRPALGARGSRAQASHVLQSCTATTDDRPRGTQICHALHSIQCPPAPQQRHGRALLRGPHWVPPAMSRDCATTGMSYGDSTVTPPNHPSPRRP